MGLAGRLTFVLLLGLVVPWAASAGEADVISVDAARSADGNWRFEVTVRHDDTGWDHYADKWEVLGPDGKVLATRVLAHPHVGEQPFTRSLSGVEIPQGMKRVRVRAHDSVHGYGGSELEAELSP
jgi:hypothetical protein